jgi:O-antigen ligase
VTNAILLFLIVAMPLVMKLAFLEFPAELLKHFPGVSPIQPDVFNWWKNSVLYCAAAGLLLATKPKESFFTRAMCVYVVAVAVSTALSAYGWVSVWGMPNYLEGAAAIFCYAILFRTAISARIESFPIEVALTLVTWVIFLACQIQYMSASTFCAIMKPVVFGAGSSYELSMQTWPLFGTVMNSNVLGTFAALVYAFFLARGNTFMTMVSVLIAVGSQSRGAWLAMCVATVYLAIKYRKWRVSLPAIFFVVGVALVYLHPTHGGMKWSMASSSGRVYVWKNTLRILEPHHMFYGDGPGVFAVKFPQGDAAGKRAQGWTPELVVDRPHNFYLQVLHASGLISLVALLALFGAYFIKSKEVALNAAVLSYLVNVCFTDSCTSVAPLFLIILGTGVGRLKNSVEAS